MSRYTLCYRYYRCRYLRKLSFQAPFKAMNSLLIYSIPLTNWIYSEINRTVLSESNICCTVSHSLEHDRKVIFFDLWRAAYFCAESFEDFNINADWGTVFFVNDGGIKRGCCNPNHRFVVRTAIQCNEGNENNWQCKYFRKHWGLPITCHCKVHAFCIDCKCGQRLCPNFTETAGEMCWTWQISLNTKFGFCCGCLIFYEKKYPMTGTDWAVKLLRN